jgi:hypothetical protein
MYYDRVVTDEFGNLVKSNEEGVGVPTKGKYRFKLKYNQPKLFKNRATASLIVPSLNRDHGGSEGTEQQRWTTDISQYSDSNVSNIGEVFGGGDVTIIPAGPGSINFIVNDSTPRQSPDNPKPRTVSSDLDLDFHTFEWKQVYTISQFIKKYKRGGNRLSFIGIKSCDECGYNNYFPFTTAVKKTSLAFGLQRLFISFIAAILKILIILGNIRICSSFRITGGKCRKIIDGAPFSFITTALNAAFPGGIELSCEPEPYLIQPTCQGFSCTSCSNGDDIVVNGNAYGSTDGCCCKRSDGSCETCGGSGTCIGFTFLTPNENNCNSLSQLEQWKCCAILEAARENGAIKLSFFDAWLNGSAYLFQFKAKTRLKNDGTTKDKFCGPGSDNVGGDNYINYSLATLNYTTLFGLDQFDFPKNTCSNGNCLVLGPSIDPADRNYVGGDQPPDLTTPPNISAWPFLRVMQNSPGIPNGANDAGEWIYCNWVSSTKIISLGRIEMCEDVYNEIKECITTNTENLQGNTIFDCSISDLRLGDTINPYTGDNLGPLSPYQIPNSEPATYNPPQVIKVGTGGENGFDRSETIKKLDSTSYQDPTQVLIYLLSQENCNFGALFLNPGETPVKCHELELYPQYQEQIREVCKVHNDVVTVPLEIVDAGGNSTGQYDFENPEVWDITGIADQIDPNATPGPFSVDELLRDRYHPNPDNSPNNSPENINVATNPHIDPKTNMPYFYFGLVPGKTAIDKFRKKYLV